MQTNVFGYKKLMQKICRYRAGNSRNRMKNLLFVFNPMAGKGLIINKIYSVIAYYTEKEYLVTRANM